MICIKLLSLSLEEQEEQKEQEELEELEEEEQEEVVEECASFPHGDFDDLADSMTQAILRFRQGGFITTPDDDEQEPVYRRKMEYY